MEELHIPSAAVAPPSSLPLSDAKRALRAEMLVRRTAGFDAAAGPRLAAQIAHLGPFRAGATVAAFHPTGAEIDVLPALGWFAGRGHATALPVVPGRGQPLRFRTWTPGDPLVRGVLDIPVPEPAAPELVPEILLVPLLAFDRSGFRLGYGGGYYDRTLATLRSGHRFVLAIGVGFACQEVPDVPHDATDARLDALATESWAMRFS